MSQFGYPSFIDRFVSKVTGGGGTTEAIWGMITGTLSDQTDLQDALDGKADLVHNHDASEITSGTLVLARGGTGSSLVDPGADRILFWDDSGNAVAFLSVSTGLDITGTTLTATGGGGSGSVTSVDQSLVKDDTETLTGGPVTASGTLTRTAVDAGADKLVGWDDSADKKIYFALGTGLSTTGTTLNVTVTGTVTSVAETLSKDDTETISGSPVTGAGTIARTAVDAGSDKLVFWDDSADKKSYLTLGTGLSITGTTINASASGITEFRFTADSDTGFDNPSANLIEIVTGGTSRFRISSSASTISGTPKGSGVSNGIDVIFEGGTAGTSQGGANGKGIVRGGSSAGNNGGAAELRGGDGVAGGGGSVPGGPVTVQGGASDGSQLAGTVTLRGGANSSTGGPGDINILGGVPTAFAGGSILITASAGVGTNKAGGSLSLTAGAATGTGQPGYVNLQGSGSELATTAIGGMVVFPSCNGTPTGTPGSIPTGTIPSIFDRANNLLYFYANSAWRTFLTTLSDITIGENHFLSYTSALSADGKYSGNIKTGTLGETVAFGETCYYKSSDSKWYKGKGDSTSTSINWLAVCVVAGAANAATKMLIEGYVRADSLFPTLTVGAPIYLSSATAGLITQTAPATLDHVVRHLGFAESADIMYFKPDNFYVTRT